MDRHYLGMKEVSWRIVHISKTCTIRIERLSDKIALPCRYIHELRSEPLEAFIRIDRDLKKT